MFLPCRIKELQGTGGDPEGKGYPENPPTLRRRSNTSDGLQRRLGPASPAPALRLACAEEIAGAVVRKNFFRPWIGWWTFRSPAADTAHVASSNPRPLVLLTQDRCIPLAYDTRPFVKRPLTGPGPW